MHRILSTTVVRGDRTPPFLLSEGKITANDYIFFIIQVAIADQFLNGSEKSYQVFILVEGIYIHQDVLFI